MSRYIRHTALRYFIHSLLQAQKKPKKSPPKKSPPRDSESVWSKIYRSLELSETPREITGRQKEFDFISDFIGAFLPNFVRI